MMRFIAEMRRLSGGKPAGFKLCIGHPWEFLAICKAIVVQHDGTIALVPTARGATFALDLPAVGAPMPAVDLLGDLRAAYAAALPLQVEALIELLDAPDPAARNEAHTLAHRLHGTAGTYGLPRVSDAAAWIERVLDGTAPRTELDDAVAALRAAVLEA
jgi:HPt (histidine-containing phosphotransfer) domain-containing protein